MSKNQEALNKAKKSGINVAKYGKNFGTGVIQLLGGTAGALGSTILSTGEIGVKIISDVKGNNEGKTKEERKKYKDRSEKYSKKSKKHIKRAGKFGKTAARGAGNLVKGSVGVVGNAIKGSYYLVDAGDKFIGEKIEKNQIEKGKKIGKIQKFFRDNALKLIIALSLIGYKGPETIALFSNTIEATELIKQKQFVKNFFTSLSLNEIEDFKTPCKKLQDDRENKYLGKDDTWNKMNDGYEHRKGMIRGMCRMIDSEVMVGEGESSITISHLEMIIQKAIETRVPIQVVFLALAESYWNANADSGVARGYWQFTKDTARRYGLIDENGNDYRSDPVKSTEAAMRHLRDNYNQVSNYARKKGYNLSESDKWIFAFFMYNGSPRLVKEGMDACNGNVNEYAEKQINSENRNYVPRILAIQKVLQSIFEENEYNINRVRITCLDYKTGADLQLKEFKKQSSSLTQEERLEALDSIKRKYEQEYNQGIIPKNYYNKAKHKIKELKKKEKLQGK